MCSSPAPRRLRFLGLPVDDCGMAEAAERVVELARAPEPSSVVFLNVDVMVKADRGPALRAAIEGSDLSLMDGRPPLWVARRMGVPLREKVSGSDLVPLVCARAAGEGLSVFVLGGAPGVPEAARDALLASHPGLRVVGAYSPRVGFERDVAELALMDDMVRDAAPDILLVCLSCPKQELYVAGHKDAYRAPVSISCGATVDFLAGSARRAPAWASRLGVEWLYRFLREPRRLFRRYFVDSWHFLAMVVRGSRAQREVPA